MNNIREKARQNAQDMRNEVLTIISVFGVLGVVSGLRGLAHILTIKKDVSDFGLLLRKEWFGLFFPGVDGVVSIVTTILIVIVLIMAFRLAN